MRKRTSKFEPKKVMWRYKIIHAIFVLWGLLILAWGAKLMFLESAYWIAVGERYEKNNEPIPAKRGDILAADGRVLATSLPEYVLIFDPMSGEPDSLRRIKDQHRRDSLLYSNLDSIIVGMKNIIPDLNEKKTRQAILNGRKKQSRYIRLYDKRVSYIQYTELKKLPLFRLSSNKGGFTVEERQRRNRPFGNLANRTIGKFHPSEDKALTGMELHFDSLLTGTPGRYHRQIAMGKSVAVVDIPPINGCDVKTTLDVEMQDIVERTLNKQLKKIEADAGMCILMEVETGDVKAISSLSKTKKDTYMEIEPRAVSNMREPGSVFKLMSFMVAMDDGKITMNSTCDTENGVKDFYGRKMKEANWRKGGDGILAVPDIIKKSSNIGVSTLIERAYNKNPDQFVDGIYRIGVCEDLKIPIPGYSKPRVPHKRENPKKWSKVTLPWMSIGYVTQIPPISTLTFYNGVANGGKMVRPRFVTEILRDNEVIQKFPVEVIREQMCKPEVLRDIQICLEGVVGKNSGTGVAAYSKNFKIAGKTGTAQIWTKGEFQSKYFVSFAGYFPAQKPKYSMIVCIEKGYPAYGGLHCGPVFKKIAETIMARQLSTHYAQIADTTALRTAAPTTTAGNLRKLKYTLEELGFSPNMTSFPQKELLWGRNKGKADQIELMVEPSSMGVPSVIGYGLRDAVYRLERLGIKVKVKGYGRVVRQNVPPETPLKGIKTITLELSHNGNIREEEYEEQTQIIPLAPNNSPPEVNTKPSVKPESSALPTENNKKDSTKEKVTSPPKKQR